MTIVLTLPPCLNATYKVAYNAKLGRSVFYASAEAKAWKEECYYTIKKQKLLTKDLEVSVTLYLNRDRDIDSSIKTILDVMKGRIYEDDRQIIALHLFKETDKLKPRCEIDVTEVE